ncbi:MAG: Extracellular ligand-binding receptor, partial [Variovorax sp.]|nr:Extracellular ligand-binding receptor [Variovorax sp.]
MSLFKKLACAVAIGAAVGAGLVAAPAFAAPVKVGIALDISGPFAALGAEARDGFALGIKQLNGKLGGQDVEFVQADMAG